MRDTPFIEISPATWRLRITGTLDLEEEGLFGRCLATIAATGSAIPLDDRSAAHLLGVNHNQYKAIKKRLLLKGKLVKTCAGFSTAPIGNPPEMDRTALSFLAREIYERQQIPPALRKAVYARDRYTCQEPGCGRKTHLSVDHIIAVTSGGTTTLENLRTLCLPCNIKKGAKNGGASCL